VKRRQYRHWLVGVSGMKGFLYKNLEKTDPLERGYCGFPRDLDEEFFRQLCSERRMTDTDKSGYTVMWWEKLPQVRNEVLDKGIYAEAAARRLTWHAMGDEAWERLRAERECPAPDQQLELLDPARTLVAAAAASGTTNKGGSITDRLA
jgi:phage terminase large subunit GpA-like protein